MAPVFRKTYDKKFQLLIYCVSYVEDLGIGCLPNLLRYRIEILGYDSNSKKMFLSVSSVTLTKRVNHRFIPLPHCRKS